ncbi:MULTISPECIES: hypothetical protein [unclassified Streptomyces]|uniref:hypothetical protein n=1 Tax=unclassified Streptomyces TaxID=2593676 RepID=UPI0034051ED4
MGVRLRTATTIALPTALIAAVVTAVRTDGVRGDPGRILIRYGFARLRAVPGGRASGPDCFFW